MSDARRPPEEVEAKLEEALAGLATDAFAALPQFESAKARDALAYASRLAGGASYAACGLALYLTERLFLKRCGRQMVDAPLLATPAGGFAAHVLATMAADGRSLRDLAQPGPDPRPASARHAEGYGELSQRDIDLIEEGHAAMLADPKVATALPELDGRRDGAREMVPAEILPHLGHGPDDIQGILEGIEEERSIARAFARMRN